VIEIVEIAKIAGKAIKIASIAI
jgi:hypothetical protein